jgi:hypothetical protein
MIWYALIWKSKSNLTLVSGRTFEWYHRMWTTNSALGKKDSVRKRNVRRLRSYSWTIRDWRTEKGNP